MPNRRSCAVVGLGNIGSHAAILAARLAVVGRVILVDFDDVEEQDLTAQGVRHSDLGRPKAVVTGRRLRQVRGDLDVVVHAMRLEDLPLGDLRADVLLGCLDSRAARMVLNERAMALGVPLVDAGVAASALLARVSAFGCGGPCLECSWDEAAYASVEAVHSCDGTTVDPAPTSAPAFLGAVAAALQVAACAAILHGSTAGLARETILDLAHGRLVVSTSRARASCRMAPHRPLQIERLAAAPGSIALGAVLDLAAPRVPGEARSIRCARGPFVTRLRCAACAAERSIVRLASFVTRHERPCPKCGGAMVAGGMDLREKLDCGTLKPAQLRRSLASIGLGVGDVLTIQAVGASRHFEIVAPQPASSCAGVA